MTEIKTQTQDPASTKKIFRTVKQESPIIVTQAPHVLAPQTLSARMWTYILCLLPVCFGAVFLYGVKPIWILIHTVSSAVIFELLFETVSKKPTRIFDGSTVLMGVLLAMSLPVTAPWWICWIGSFFTIFIAKELAGGLGRFRFHPVAFGLILLFFLYPVLMNHPGAVSSPFYSGEAGILSSLFFGSGSGPMGQTSFIAVFFSGVLLIWKRLIRWESALIYLTSVMAVSLAVGINPFQSITDPGILFAAVFFITEPVTSPLTARGNIVFALTAGILTVLLGLITGHQEGILFSVLMMNLWVPLIDKYVKIKPLLTKCSG